MALTNKNIALILLTLFSLVLIFHTLILTGFIPYNITWGGRLETWEEMVVFESISIIINLLMMMVVAIAGGIVSWKMKPFILSIILWSMAVLFAVNTLGNLMAINPLEKWIATPLTLISAILCWRLAVGVRKG